MSIKESDQQQHMQRTAARFSGQAMAYADLISLGSGELNYFKAIAQPKSTDVCLDVATGTGPVALMLATDVKSVIGIDVAAGMLQLAEEIKAKNGVSNIDFIHGDAHNLQFADRSFSLITCRLALHHFHDLKKSLSEMIRVLKPTGRIVIEDCLSPADAAAAAFLEMVEKKRDPSHAHALTQSEWLTTLGAYGFVLTASQVMTKRRSFLPWVKRAGMADKEISELIRIIQDAPVELVSQFFTFKDGVPAEVVDERIIFQAEFDRPALGAPQHHGNSYESI